MYMYNELLMGKKIFLFGFFIFLNNLNAYKTMLKAVLEFSVSVLLKNTVVLLRDTLYYCDITKERYLMCYKKSFNR